MGYEIPGGMGVKLAAPDREVFVMVGDGSYLMLPGELSTAVAEGIKLVVVLVENHGYASIGALSRSVGVGRLRHALPRRAANGARSPRRRRRGARRRAAAGRPRRERREPRRARAARAARSTSCARRSPRRASTAAGRSSCTSRSTATPACRATSAGGTCRSPRSAATTAVRAARARVRGARARRSAAYVETP